MAFAAALAVVLAGWLIIGMPESDSEGAVKANGQRTSAPSRLSKLSDCQRPAPGSAMAITGCVLDAGSLVEALAHEDIRLLNERIKLAIAMKSQDEQSPGSDKGHILDASTWGGADGIDWLSVGYLEKARHDILVGDKVLYHRRVKYDKVTARNHRSGSRAEVTASGYWEELAGVRVTTKYELDHSRDYVKITSTLYNGTTARADFYFGDVMDYDGAGESSYIPGAGTLRRPKHRRIYTADSWVGMWGKSPTSYALFYEDPVVIIGNGSWVKSSRRFELGPGQKASMVRYLIIKDATEYDNDNLAAIRAAVDEFPASGEVATTTITVTDQAGRPLAGARVMLDREIANGLEELVEGVSGEDGKVSLRTRPGIHALHVFKPGYFRLPTRDIKLPRGKSALKVDLHPRATRPIKHVILIISDGVGWDAFNEVLKELPPAERAKMMPSLAAAGRGVSEVPSITAVNKATIFTGAHAHTHGVVGNVFCRRQRGHLDSLEAAVKRAGLTYNRVGKAGILRLIAKGDLPAVSVWWCYDTDGVGHKYGEDSPQYRSQVRKMLADVGDIRRSLAESGMADSTVLAFGSDHGHLRLMPPAKWKCKSCGRAFWGQAEPPDKCPACKAEGPFSDVFSPIDTGRVVDLRGRLEAAGFARKSFKWFGSGPRMAHINLADPGRAPAVKKALAGTEGVDRVFTKSELDRADLGPGVRAYLDHPNAGDVIVFAAPLHSFGRLAVRHKADCLPSADCLIRGKCLGLYWDTRKGSQGGHGGLTDREMYVPFILWGKAVKPGAKTGYRHNVDWAATIAALLEIDPPRHSEGSPALGFLRNQPPVVKVDRSGQSLKPGGAIAPVRISATDRGSSSMTMHTSWTRDGGLEQPGLPTGLKLVQVKPKAGGPSSREVIISGAVMGRPGVYRVRVSFRDDGLPAPPSLTTTATVIFKVAAPAKPQ